METLLSGIGFVVLALLGAPLFAIIGAIAMMSFSRELKSTRRPSSWNSTCISSNPTLVGESRSLRSQATCSRKARPRRVS